jgi:hypothetical protein
MSEKIENVAVNTRVHPYGTEKTDQLQQNAQRAGEPAEYLDFWTSHVFNFLCSLLLTLRFRFFQNFALGGNHRKRSSRTSSAHSNTDGMLVKSIRAEQHAALLPM